MGEIQRGGYSHFAPFLTRPQQRFILAYTTPGGTWLNAVRSYLLACPGVTYNTAAVAGCRNLKRSKVRYAIERRLAGMGYTKDRLEGELGWNLETSKAKGKLNEHRNATMDLARLRGDLIERKEVTHLSDDEKQAIRRVALEGMRNGPTPSVTPTDTAS